MRILASEIGLATEQWIFALSQGLAQVETPVEVPPTLVLHKAVASVRQKTIPDSRMESIFLPLTNILFDSLSGTSACQQATGVIFSNSCTDDNSCADFGGVSIGSNSCNVSSSLLVDAFNVPKYFSIISYFP